MIFAMQDQAPAQGITSIHRRGGYNAERLTQDPYRGVQHHRCEHPQHRPSGLRSAGRQRHHVDSEEPVISEDYPTPKAQARCRIRWSRIGQKPYTVHTYPESHPDNGISIFRADIDVSPAAASRRWRALNYLITPSSPTSSSWTIACAFYPRRPAARKHFIDHKISSIQNFLSRDTRENTR